MIYREKGVYDIVICMRGHYSRVPTLLRSGAYPRRLSLPRPDGASVGLLTVVLHLIRGRRRPSLYFLYNVSRRYIKNLGRNRHSLALIGVYLFCFLSFYAFVVYVFGHWVCDHLWCDEKNVI